LSTMKMSEQTLLNRCAKKLARPLSQLACSRVLYKPFRVLDAYLHFVLGLGSGTGWDLDSEVRAALSLTYRPEPVVFDVGANVGAWSDCFFSMNPAARLFLFEPSPTCCEEIAKRPQLRNANIVQAAIGERMGKAHLFFSEPTDGSASLHRRGDTFFEDLDYSQVEVDVLTIDDFIKANKVAFVDFLKMDVEGHELFALNGAKTALSERRIGALLFEFGSGNINSLTFFRQFWNLLASHGFRIWRITPGGKPVLIDEYYEDLEYFRGVSNYVAQLKDHPFAPISGGLVPAFDGSIKARTSEHASPISAA
jgi:FkbM family methyltransferase